MECDIMAIKKKVISSNGIVTEYHRIALIQMEINQQNTILVHSYLSEDGRQIEKDYERRKLLCQQKLHLVLL